ncbi:GTP-binding protein [Nocardiopsis sp. N85]|nr:GTP-binding protein [Nocardiopsis sp. N85]MDE3722208.1 GTP-binding protein [Nocardiopsis sp. N85]
MGEARIYLVDAPGHTDVVAEVERAPTVWDGAVLVLSAVEGAGPHPGAGAHPVSGGARRVLVPWTAGPGRGRRRMLVPCASDIKFHDGPRSVHGRHRVVVFPGVPARSTERPPCSSRSHARAARVCPV